MIVISTPVPRENTEKTPWIRIAIFVLLALLVAGLAWHSVIAGGIPDPTKPGTTKTSATLDIGILVFREGLECILVLAAITASMKGPQEEDHRRPVAAGVVIGMIATLVTWLITVRILDDLSESVSALDLQAATGLLAIVVLLIVMNWFFHKIYWTGWISLHNRKKRELTSDRDATMRRICGLGLLGFSSFYREGFEVVLFLQSYRLRLGGRIVLEGVSIGIVLSAAVAVLTFVAHRKLPYRRMLILTGVMLGVVLLVMVGEQVQEMQLAHWIPSHEVPWLASSLPAWMGLWFAVFPNIESLLGQAIAFVLVVGSYFWAGRQTHEAKAMEPNGSISFVPKAAESTRMTNR